MVNCLICNEYLLLYLLFCYHSVTDLGEKFIKYPLATSLFRSRTLSVEAKEMIVQRLNMTICRHPSLQEQCSCHFSEAVTHKRWSSGGGSLCNSYNKSYIKTRTSYVSFIHIKQQCFKQNHKKEQFNICSSLYLH